MLTTLPSIHGLADVLGCEPKIECGPPNLGVLQYEVSYETEAENLSLKVLPLAEEIHLRLVTRNPLRSFSLALADVSSVTGIADSEGTRIEIAFLTEVVQPLNLSLKPVLILRWGNWKDSPERHPPWERE